MEYLPIKSYKIGGNAVAYVNGTDNFKVCYDGIAYNLLEVAPADYYATNKFIAYYLINRLTVFDNGKKKILSYNTENYEVGDSIIGVFDKNSSTLKVYSNGMMEDLEMSISRNNFSNFKVGSNLLAYLSINDHLKIYYHSKIFDIEKAPPDSLKLGGSIVAYVDGYSKTFKVFYDGEVYTLEKFPPFSFSAANNMVAYVDNTGNFKVFFKGQIFTIASFEPVFYEVKDNVLVFFVNNFFSGFYNGEIKRLESYVPTEYQLSYNHIVYKDRRGFLKGFYDGSQIQISKEQIKNFQLTGNVVKFNTGLSDFLFYNRGKYVFH